MHWLLRETFPERRNNSQPLSASSQTMPTHMQTWAPHSRNWGASPRPKLSLNERLRSIQRMLSHAKICSSCAAQWAATDGFQFQDTDPRYYLLFTFQQTIFVIVICTRRRSV